MCIVTLLFEDSTLIMSLYGSQVENRSVFQSVGILWFTNTEKWHVRASLASHYTAGSKGIQGAVVLAIDSALYLEAFANIHLKQYVKWALQLSLLTQT